MSSPGPTTVIATGVGLVLASVFTGAAYASSYWAIPAFALPTATATSKTSAQMSSSSPSHLVRQWRDMYQKGKVVGPMLSSISAASWFYAASTFPKSTYGRNLHIAAGILIMCIGPFTLTVMARTNNELLRRADIADKGKEFNEDHLNVKRAKGVEEYPTQDLLSWWSVLNVGRGLLPVAAIVCVAYGSF